MIFYPSRRYTCWISEFLVADALYVRCLNARPHTILKATAYSDEYSMRLAWDLDFWNCMEFDLQVNTKTSIIWKGNGNWCLCVEKVMKCFLLHPCFTPFSSLGRWLHLLVLFAISCCSVHFFNFLDTFLFLNIQSSYHDIYNTYCIYNTFPILIVNCGL